MLTSCHSRYHPVLASRKNGSQREITDRKEVWVQLITGNVLEHDQGGNVLDSPRRLDQCNDIGSSLDENVLYTLHLCVLHISIASEATFPSFSESVLA